MKKIYTYFALLVFLFNAFPYATAQNSKATLEVVKVSFRMKENSVIYMGILGKEEFTLEDYQDIRSAGGIERRAGEIKFRGIAINTDRLRNNFTLYDDYLGRQVMQRLADSGHDVVGYTSYFKELQERNYPDYKIVIVIKDMFMRARSDLRLGYSLVTFVKTAINYKVEILDCASDQLVFSKEFTNLFTIDESSEIYVDISPKSTEDQSGITRELMFRLVDDMLAQPEIDALFNNKDEPASTQFADAISFSNSGAPTTFSAAKLVESSVTLTRGSAHGSGTFISTDGLLLTCEHVLGNSDEIDVYLNNSVRMKGKVVRRNKEKDVALVKVDGITTVPVRLAASKPEIGAEVYAVGTPADRQLNQSITRGILSGQRTLEGINYLQTDASISPGNSGGALTNGKGELVGVVTAKLVGVGAEGLGFAIPLAEALEAVNASATK